MFNKKTIKDVDLHGKVVLLRADYNVPISYDENGDSHILSDFRIRASLPTLKFLLEQGVRKIIIISHLGRPNSMESLADLPELEHLANGKRKFSLLPVFRRLQQLLAEEFGENLDDFKLNFPMNFHSMPIFSRTRYSVSMKQADDDYKIEMLENLRFSKDEKRNSADFAEALLQITGADLFVQDGFGVVHRAHTSTSEIVKKLPSVAGLLLEKEVSTISKSIKNPTRPLVVVMGGAKISDKLPLIEKFIDIADEIVVCGALANAFLKNRQVEIGKSKVDEINPIIISQIEKRAIDKFRSGFYNDFQLPVDVKIAHEFSPSASDYNVDINQVLPGDYILDIGNESAHRAIQAIASAKTVIWNGTVGYAEFSNFAKGSEKIAAAISEATKNGATSIIGGGDTSAFVLDWQENHPGSTHFSLISTGGGAALELMSGEELPGVETLPEKSR